MAENYTPRPSESMHWYALDGSPAYEVEAVKGGMRPTTLRDARKMKLVPSVTSIIRSAAAPGLERWKQEQVLLAALTLARKPDEAESSYIARIIQDSQEQGRRAAQRGTAIHASVQGHYEGKPPSEEHWEYVRAAAAKVEETYGKQDWLAEKSFSHPLGFGGKVDLHCPIAVIDFKSKEFTDDSKKLAWDEHRMQLAACRVGLGIPQAKCGNVFVSVSKPGLALCHEWSEDELAEGWTMFSSLLRYWQAKSGYNSAFELKAAA